jgi:hypothetical protein
MPCNPLPGSQVSDSWHADRGGGRQHLGIDLMGSPGSIVYAYTDGCIGTKLSGGVDPGMMGVRLAGGDGNHYFYNHLEPGSLIVQPGECVKAGQPIARIGDPSKYGYSFPSHLHFSINEGYSNAQNPYPLLTGAPGCGSGGPTDLEQAADAPKVGAPPQPESLDPTAANSNAFDQNQGNVRDRFYLTGETVRNFLTGQDTSAQSDVPQITPAEQRKTPMEQLADQMQAQGVTPDQPQQMAPTNGNPATYGGWAQMFLGALGAPDNPQNRALMIAWMRREGTHATWNPLATTQGGFNSTGAINSVGVKNYASALDGIAAEIHALQNGRYPTILAGLMQGNPDLALSNQDEWRTWGSGDIRSIYVDVSSSLDQWANQTHRAAGG